MSVEQDLQAILTARYGRDVRQSIHDAIEDINTVAKSADSVAQSAQNSALTYSQLAKDYKDEAKALRDEAQEYSENAFSATPEGYAEVVQKVNGLDIAVRTGKTFLVEDSTNGNCLVKTIYGMSEQDGTPAPTAPMPIKDMQVKLRNKGKNLVYFPHTGHPMSQYPFTYKINGVTFVFLEDGTIIANGTATSDAAANINSFYAYDTSNDLVKGRTYYISDGREGIGTHYDGYVQFTLTNADDEHGWVTGTSNTGKAEYTYDGDQYDRWGIRVNVAKGQTANHVVIKPMVSYSDDTSYVMGTPKEDKETDIILRALEVEADDNYNLVKDGKYYIADTLDDTENGYVITRRVGHVVLDGTENWTKSDTNEEGAYRRILNDSRFPSYAQLGTTLPTPNKKGYIVSSAYPECMTNGLRHPYYCSVAIALHDTGHWCQIYDERYNGASDIAEWKAHLAEEPLTVNYRLFKWEKEIVSSADAQILYNLISEEGSTTLELVSDVDGVMDVIIPSTTAAGVALTGYINARLNTVKLNEMQTALMELEGVQN